MSGSPKFKIYNLNREYIGCVKYAEDAAALVALQGDGATVKYDHGKVIWREGAEELSAGESYDEAARVMYRRIDKMRRASYARSYEALHLANLKAVTKREREDEVSA